MQAKNVEKHAKNLKNFGGIFSVGQLKNVKIISYPVSLIIYDTGHWLSAYLTNDTVELMDSSGYLNAHRLNQSLINLLCCQSFHKKFFATPKLQPTNSVHCAKFALSFLFYRTFTDRSLCSFCKLFDGNLNLNIKIISEIFDCITK